jgi:phospholipid/cholesterol/gamma-HCH transport system permease protein
MLLQPIRFVGEVTLGTLGTIGGVGLMIRDGFLQFVPGLIRGRGRRLGWANLWAQMVRVGVRAIPIVSLVVFCIGAILSLQMAPILADFGAVEEVARIIGIAMARELGPLVGAIVLTGYAGAAIAAEIGTMTVSEEIEALETHAISPVRFLVLPRVVATTVMTTCLAVVATLMGMAGGLIVSWGVLGISPWLYLANTIDSITMLDFLTGLFKAAVFGAIISGLACYLGLTVTGGAMGVGRATTRTVVLTIVALITVDLLFTAVFYVLGV